MIVVVVDGKGSDFFFTLRKDIDKKEASKKWPDEVAKKYTKRGGFGVRRVHRRCILDTTAVYSQYNGGVLRVHQQSTESTCIVYCEWHDETAQKGLFNDSNGSVFLSSGYTNKKSEGAPYVALPRSTQIRINDDYSAVASVSWSAKSSTFFLLA